MTARVVRLLGQILGWAIFLAAVLVGLLLALLFGALGWLFLIGAKLFKILTRKVDGSSDGGEPDALTEGLRDQIDGRRTTAARQLDQRLNADEQLDCGCLRLAWPQATCPRCGYTTCVGHSPMTHYCGQADVKADPLDAWLNEAPRIKPANLDSRPESVPSSAPAGDDFAAWEQECDDLKRWAKKLKGKR